MSIQDKYKKLVQFKEKIQAELRKMEEELPEAYGSACPFCKKNLTSLNYIIGKCDWCGNSYRIKTKYTSYSTPYYLPYDLPPTEPVAPKPAYATPGTSFYTSYEHQPIYTYGSSTPISHATFSTTYDYTTNKYIPVGDAIDTPKIVAKQKPKYKYKKKPYSKKAIDEFDTWVNYTYGSASEET